ncbi:MAG: integrase [Verrucomicrobia bacterium]|nr:integrase [Verrucomicrobiota bacterium]
MDKTMSHTTRKEILNKFRRRYRSAGAEHKRKLLDQAQELLGYHRKSAIRALSTPVVERTPGIITGRPVIYEPNRLVPWLRPIWRAADYACSRRLAAMLPEWVPAYEEHERRLPNEVRDKLLSASARTLDRLLEPLRCQESRRSLTRPGTLLRQQIPIRGSVWEEGKAGWLEVDTVALCGGSVAGEFVWMLDGVDYATTWVELRAMWGRGQAGTLAALRDLEGTLPFALLGLDSDNGGEFLNHHVLSWLQKRTRPVFLTRSRPNKKDDNAHVEQKNWTHIRQCFGYERYDNPEVVQPINDLVTGPYGQLLNYFHASLKLQDKEHQDGRIKRVYGAAQTPFARVLASAEVTVQTKRRLQQEKAKLNPFALKLEVDRKLKVIAAMRRARP